MSVTVPVVVTIVTWIVFAGAGLPRRRRASARLGRHADPREVPEEKEVFVVSVQVSVSGVARPPGVGRRHGVWNERGVRQLGP